MIIYHHLGLGDHIICNGLVRHFAEADQVTLLCKYHNAKNIKFMYRDHPNITVYDILNDEEANQFCNIQTQNNIDVLRIGFAVGGKRYYDCLWDENFYKNAYIDFDLSWSKFVVVPDEKESLQTYKKLNPTNEDYIFIHSTDSTNTDRIDYSIIDSRIKVIKTDSSISFFDYYGIIQNAKEIHCIDSSFKHLVDRIPTTGKLFYHKLKHPKPYDLYNSKKEWYIV